MEKFVDLQPLLLPEAHQRFAIEEITAVAHVRRAAMNLAAWGNFNETDAGKVGIVVTELATNIVKHAGRGELLLRLSHRTSARSCIEIIALDSGPGISDLAACMRDGMSTTGTAGAGLGAMRRLADEFEAYSSVGQGSAFYLSLWSGAPPSPFSVPASPLQFGAVSLPLAGEESCGDAWYCELRGDTALIAVADGLGHGPDAAIAARAALSVCADPIFSAPARLLDLAHQRARPTRGAAVAFATAHLKAGSVHYSGIGNIAGSVCDEQSRRHLISHNGIVGHTTRKAREMAVEWNPEAAIILHSDGISTQWALAAYPGLLQCHPALIAAVIYRDFTRQTDDATVLVIKRAAPKHA